MSTEKPKQECPYCKKIVSTHEPIWKGHIAKHVEAGDEKMYEISNGGTTKPKLSTSDPKLQVLLERAENAQKRFYKAPEAFVSGELSDHRRALAKIYVGEEQAFGIPNPRPPLDGSKPFLKVPTHHVYFGEGSSREGDVSKGYMPVINEHGEHVQDGGDWMYTKPYTQYEMEQAAYGRQSTHKVQQMTAEMRELKNDSDVKDSIEEEITLEKGNIYNG